MKNALLFISLLFVLGACGQKQEKSEAIRFLIGTTDKSDSSGVSVARLDPESGEISFEGFTPTAPGPGYLTFSPDKNAVFIVTGDQMVSSYRFSDGELTLIGSQPANGLNPCHVAVLPSGKMIFVSNYSDGSFSAYAVEDGYQLSEAIYTEKYEGSGPHETRQQKPHAHCSTVTPDGRYVYTADLGTDRVMNYRVEGSEIRPNAEQPFFAVHPGAGPRHLLVHPSGKYLYLLNELDATITAARIDENGVLQTLETYHTMESGENEPGNTSAAIRLHPNGNFLYVSNRGYNAIHGFKIEADGKLTRVNEVREGIAVPRDFNIDPSGRYLIVGNQGTHDLTVLTVDPNTGELAYKAQAGPVKSPSCIEFF